MQPEHAGEQPDGERELPDLEFAELEPVSAGENRDKRVGVRFAQQSRPRPPRLPPADACGRSTPYRSGR